MWIIRRWSSLGELRYTASSTHRQSALCIQIHIQGGKNQTVFLELILLLRLMGERCVICQKFPILSTKSTKLARQCIYIFFAYFAYIFTACEIMLYLTKMHKFYPI